jgi:uncharacterized protein YqgC (DUF456 family)
MVGLPEPAVLAAFVLLAAGMVGSVVPLVPSGLFSLAGVGVYRFGTGEPGTPLLVALAAVCLVASLVDWFGGAIAANAGGASTRTTAVAAVAGLLLLPLGPLGVLLGMAGAVFLIEYREHGDEKQGVRSAAYATAGVLASAAVQLLLTGAVFGAVLLVYFL